MSLYGVLFADTSGALRAVARQIRWQYRSVYPAPDGCIAQTRAAGASPPTIATLVHGVATWRTIALETNGLEIGFNGGYLDNGACGLTGFLIPYSAVLPYSSALGARLIQSVGGEPSPWDRIGLPPGAFPRPTARALALVARHAHFPTEGPTQAPDFGLVPSIGVSATVNSYFVDYYPCSPPVRMNSPKLNSCVTANLDIIGGFGGLAYATHAKAVHALLACSAWTCEVRVRACRSTSRHAVVDGQRVSLCPRAGPIGEVSWRRGTWTFIVQPTSPDEWHYQTQAIVAEERSVKRLPPYVGVLQNDPGGDNNNTVIEWTVGSDDYIVNYYFGGGLASAASFRPFRL